jgi:hypothetical protein
VDLLCETLIRSSAGYSRNLEDRYIPQEFHSDEPRQAPALNEKCRSCAELGKFEDGVSLASNGQQTAAGLTGPHVKLLINVESDAVRTIQRGTTQQGMSPDQSHKLGPSTWHSFVMNSCLRATQFEAATRDRWS